MGKGRGDLGDGRRGRKMNRELRGSLFSTANEDIC
jgi:hypothetical protein